jgi:hypothetical protein
LDFLFWGLKAFSCSLDVLYRGRFGIQPKMLDPDLDSMNPGSETLVVRVYDSKATELVYFARGVPVPYLECLAVRRMTRACGAASLRIVVARGRLSSWLTTPSPQYTTVHFSFLHTQKSALRIRMFLGILDPIRILLLSSKNSLKNLDSCCFVTSF